MDRHPDRPTFGLIEAPCQSLKNKKKTKKKQKEKKEKNKRIKK